MVHFFSDSQVSLQVVSGGVALTQMLQERLLGRYTPAPKGCEIIVYLRV